jgi:antitoxin ParD1/3/4
LLYPVIKEAVMNVSLTKELERRVEACVATGLYTSASELVREALRLFFQFDEVRKREVEELNRRIAVGLTQLDKGEGVAGDAARKENLERRSRRIRV